MRLAKAFYFFSVYFLQGFRSTRTIGMLMRTYAHAVLFKCIGAAKDGGRKLFISFPTIICKARRGLARAQQP